MSRVCPLPLLLKVLLLAMCLPGALVRAADDVPGVYELRTYTCEPGKLDCLNERFQNHTMRLFEKHGIQNVAYWVPTREPLSGNTLIYLLKHSSREAAEKSWEGFRNDPEWQAVAAEWKEKYGKVLAQAPESTFMTPTDYSPDVPAPHRDRLYELRIYTTHPDRLKNLHARFRDHTDKLFARHGLRSVGYWQPLEGPGADNVLIYVLETPGEAQAQAAWKAFSQDAEWQAARQASEADGPILSERPESVYMRPTDYSPAATE